jgi:hypothetical protein
MLALVVTLVPLPAILLDGTLKQQSIACLAKSLATFRD